MAGKTKLVMTNDWTGHLEKSLSNALNLSMEVMGRTGEEACKHGMIMMAKSARAITGKSKKRRQVMRDDQRLGPYVNVYNQGSHEPVRLYKWMLGKKNLKNVDWQKAQTIGNQGLARRSWMWGLGRIGGKPETSAIPGTSRFYAITGEKVNGYVKENKLAYILKALPAGWESAVQSAVVNKMFKQAAMKMERMWQAKVAQVRRVAAMPIRQLFLKGMA